MRRPVPITSPEGGTAIGDTTIAVLVIDDEPEAARFVVEVLREAGYLALSARSAEEALRLIGLVRFDLVVSDVVMPGIDGLGLLARIKLRDPTLPVVLMSGHADAAVAREGWRRGARGLLSKPFAPDQLVDTVRAAVRRCRRRRLSEGPEGSGLER